MKIRTGNKDITAIHKDTAAEISGLTEKTTPVNADLIIIEDSADSNLKKKVQLGNIPTGASAIHDDVAGEIVAITEKTSLAANDEFIIEDSADSNNKKSIKASNFNLSVMSNVTSAFITTSSVTYETLSANGDIGAVASTLCAGNDGRLSDARTPVSHDNTYHSSAYITTSGVTRDALYANSGIGIADNKVLEVDDATAADNDYAKFTANGIEGRTYTEVKTDLSLNNVTNVEQMPLSYLDTDGTLAANSDAKVASQKATKTYCDQLIASGDVMVYKGEIDCSTNPNYPAADRGHTYMVSVAGKIGGASGEDVEAGDIIICIDDATASGTEAAVGSSWVTIQANLNGAVIGAASSTDNAICRFDNTTGKLIQNSSATIDDNGSVNIPTGQTYKINASTVVDQSVANGAAPVLAATNFTSIKCEIGIAVSDELTDLTVGAGKVTFRMPYAMTLTAVRANVNTAPTGSTIIVDINEAGATIMTTNKLSIDATELTSVTAATPAGLTDTALADDAVITIDIDQIGSTIAGKGLKVWLIGVRA